MNNKSFQSKNDLSSSGYEDSGSETQGVTKQRPEQTSSILQVMSSQRDDYKDLKHVKDINKLQIDSDEEEVYILKVPKWINPMDLENTKFSLNKKSKLKTQSEVYHIKPLSCELQPELIMNNLGLKNISPKSILQLEKFVETKVQQDDIVEEKKKIPLPKKLIERHAIFGAEYEARIKLQEEIQEKLQQALKRFDDKKVTSKKKKKQVVENEEYDKSLLISRLLEAKINRKKLIKTENDPETKVSLEKSDIVQCETDIEKSVTKKSKKNKQNAENSFDKGENMKNSAIIIHNQQLLEMDDTSSEKKKKRKDHKNISCDNSDMLSKPDDQLHKKEKTKKKKHKHSVTSGMDQEQAEYGIGDGQEQYSTHQQETMDISTEIKGELLTDIEHSELTESCSRKKTKKKKPIDSQKIGNIKQEYEELDESSDHNIKETKSFIQIKTELLSESENLESSTNEKKKRKKRRNSEATFLAPEIIKQEVDDSFMPPAKKRKPSILSSTVIKEGSPEFKPDVSAIKSEEKNGKKSKKHKIAAIDNVDKKLRDSEEKA